MSPPMAAAAPTAEEEEHEPRAEGAPPSPPPTQLAGLTPDPEKETREEFLRRVARAKRWRYSLVEEKLRAVPALWALWSEKKEDDEGEEAEPEAPPKKRKAEPVAGAKAGAEPPKRGRPGANVALRDRLLEGGDIADAEEYERAQILIKNEMKQQLRMLKTARLPEAEAAGEAQQKLLAAADRWADANGVARHRRVAERQRNNDLLVRTGLQMITAGSRGNSELLTEEMRVSYRAA